MQAEILGGCNLDNLRAYSLQHITRLKNLLLLIMSNHWSKLPILVAIDFETSGYTNHHACAIGLCRIEYGKIIYSKSWLIKPPSKRVYFSNIHNLTWEILKDQPSFFTLWPKIAPIFKGANGCLAHNANFDRNVLIGCCNYANIIPPKLPFFCTLKGVRKILNLQKNSLDAVCEYFNIPLNHHEAQSDAYACANIFLHLCHLGAEPADLLLEIKQKKAPNANSNSRV